MSIKNRTKKYKDKVYHYQLSDQALEQERKTKLRWRSENYERIYVYAPIGMRDELKALAEKRDTSLRALVLGALRRELDEEAQR